MRSERQGRGNPYSCQDIAAGVIISPAESQPDARVRTQAIQNQEYDVPNIRCRFEFA